MSTEDFADGASAPQRVAKGTFKHEQQALNESAAGTDFITGRQKAPAQSSKNSNGRRTFGFVEAGKGTYNPVTGQQEERKPAPKIDKAAEVEAQVLPRAIGRGVKPANEEDSYKGPVDPITGQPVAARPVPRSSSGRLVRDAVNSKPDSDIISGARREVQGAPRAHSRASAGEEDVERDPITGQPRQSQSRRSSAGAMSSFMTKSDSKGNIIG